MTLTKETKSELIKKYGKNTLDTGSVATQVSLLSERIKQLGEHFDKHKKDHSSRRGLMRLVSRRKHLLDYLKKKDEPAYKRLIEQLELRK